MQCYLCASTDLKVIREKLRHGIERKVFVCQKCSLVFLDPTQENLQEYYKREYRILHSPVLGKEISAKEFFDINIPFQKVRIEKIKHLLRADMRVLDVGSSAGMFLHAIKPYVSECIGVEYDEKYAQYANEKLGIETHTRPLEQTDIKPHSFDIICALQTLEHIDDPLKFFATIKRYLKQDGFVYIEVPNHDDSLLSVFDVPGYRDFYYRQPHIFYYNPKTLLMMLERAGFQGEISASGHEPNMINQLNWILTGNPQPTATLAYGNIALPFLSNASVPIREEFMALIERFDEEYRALLAKYLLCSSIVFIGKHSC